MTSTTTTITSKALECIEMFDRAGKSGPGFTTAHVRGLLSGHKKRFIEGLSKSRTDPSGPYQLDKYLPQDPEVRELAFECLKNMIEELSVTEQFTLGKRNFDMYREDTEEEHQVKMAEGYKVVEEASGKKKEILQALYDKEDREWKAEDRSEPELTDDYYESVKEAGKCVDEFFMIVVIE